MKVLDITITINIIKKTVAELVIITEVKFIKKFLHAVGEHCHGKKWLKIKVYIVNHKGNEYTWQAVSDDHYFKFFILRSTVITGTP